MLHDSCMFCTGLGRSVPYALGVSYRITDARRGFASVKLMVDLGPCARLTSFVGLWVEGLRLRAGGPLLLRVLLFSPGRPGHPRSTARTSRRRRGFCRAAGRGSSSFSRGGRPASQPPPPLTFLPAAGGA